MTFALTDDELTVNVFLYLFLLSGLHHRAALVNFMPFGGLAHQTDGLLVVLAEDLQLLVMKEADVLVPAAPLHLIGLGCDLEGQVDGRPLGDGDGAADGTFPATFQLPELVQANFANVVAALQEDGKEVDVGALRTEQVVFAQPGRHHICQGRRNLPASGVVAYAENTCKLELLVNQLR